MATDVTIGGDGELFADEDKTLKLELLTKELDGVYDSNSVPINMTGWAVVFDVRKKDNSPTTLLLKTASIIGTYNSSRSTNTQRAQVILTDDEMHQFKGSNLETPTTYRYSWKRTDSDNETVLARGDWTPEKATAD